MTRRELLETAGRVGGSAAVYGAMTALGLVGPSVEGAAATTGGGAFHLGGESGRGRRVVILGAGLAGMCAAYELGKQGYDCRILEARARPGGRCHTIRRGTVEVETDDVRQVCAFDDGHYLNPGPARIAQHHVTLDYCRELGVAIEPFAQVNESAYFYHEGAQFGPLGGKRIRVREARRDLYGYIAELLAKAVTKSDLDARVTGEDRERLLAFLTADAGLGGDRIYRGGARRGYRVHPGAGDTAGELADPLDLKQLLQAGFGAHFVADYEREWQPMLFQIVGGMDGLARAFAKKLEKRITYQAAVREIRHLPDGAGVRIVHADPKRRGASRETTADYCICAIPLSVLKDIPADFAPPMKKAIASISYAPTGKIGLQFRRRFWEEDDRIFGGVTRTSLPLTHIFYPSDGFLGRKGVLVGYYNFGADALAYGALSPGEREKRALIEGAKIHPQYPKEFDNSFSVAWEKTPFSLGAWAEYDEAGRREHYPALSRPDGRVYLAGEHMGYLVGWMAGALESARAVAQQIHERAASEPPAVRKRKGNP